jgi:tryptophan-rich sensory protein
MPKKVLPQHPKGLRSFILALLIPQLAAIIGSLFTTSAIPTWYATLQKPSFTPPNWLFAPAWTTWFLMMGVALYRIWTSKAKTPEKQRAEKLFYLQLVLNAFWSILFFGLRAPTLAFAEIILLWGLILITLIRFWQIDRWAGMLLIPYLAWVSFAASLNFAVALLN